MTKIAHLLLKISNLLKSSGLRDHSDLLFRYYSQLSSNKNVINDPQFVIDIMNLYGGMGSFFDIVLYKEGKPLIKENNELSKLKRDLYDACIEIRTSK